MKYAFCPIHDFFRPRQKAVRDTDRVHALYTSAYTSCDQQGRELGRPKIFWRKSKVMLQSVVWPLACVASALRHTLHYGVRTRELSGKTAFRQFLEQLELGIGEGVPPRSYYLFSLFDETRKELAPAFVHYHENNYLTALFATSAERNILDEKLRFHDFCQETGFPTPPVPAVFQKGAQVKGISLPAIDLIVKPLTGYCGQRIERWVCDENGNYSSRGKGPLSGDALKTCLEKLSTHGGLLVQPRLLNHDYLAGLSTGGLCTARLVTVRTPDGKPELVAAMLRMPLGNSVVDNFSAGGIACPIDFRSGVLRGPAVSWTPLSAGHDHHLDTAKEIDGVRLPDWDKAIRICIDAHTAFTSCPAIGWDIAFTQDGPVLVEGNLPFGIEITQFVSGTPLLATPFLDAHLKFVEQSRRANRSSATSATQRVR
jgi:hypothetical protein